MRPVLSTGKCSGRLALVLGVAAFLVSLTANYLALGPSFVHTTPRHDSLQYLRDALIIQHQIFDLPGQTEDYVRRSYKDRGLQLPNEGTVSVRFGSRCIFLLFNAILLELSNGSVAAIYFANLVMVALAAALSAYVLGREVGSVSSLAFIVLLFFFSKGAQINTIMIEPMFSLVLVMMAFGAWLVSRQPLGGIAFLMITAILAPLVKGSLGPFALLGAMLCGGSLVYRYWKRKCLSIVIFAGAVYCAFLSLNATGLIKDLVVTTLSLDERTFYRGNAGYALWMGSLPTIYTGAYSGRISRQTFRFSAEEGGKAAFQRQWEQIKQYAELDDTSFYFVRVRDIYPIVIDNYRTDPMDSLARISFRYTKMVGINGFQNSIPVWTAGLALLGCVVIALTGRVAMVPWVIALQGMLWLHALSRYRPRDDAQIVIVVPFLAAVGLVWLLSRVSRARPSPDQPLSMPRWLGSSLAGVVIFPLLLSVVFPDTQSNKPPSIRYISINEENAHLKVKAFVEEPDIFARLRLPGERSGRVDQADDKGWVTFDVPWNECGKVDPSRSDTLKIEVWSRAGVKREIEVKWIVKDIE